jgi:two-component system, NarL family, sensor histidine kinase DegS
MWQSFLLISVSLALCVVSAMYWLLLRKHSPGRKTFTTRSRRSAERDRELSALMEYSSRIAQYAGVGDMLQVGLDITQETMRADAVAIFSLKEDAGHLHVMASTGFKDDGDKEWFIPLGEGLTGSVAIKGVAAYAYDYQMDFKQDAFLKKENFSAVAVLPLVARGKIMGILLVAYHRQHIFSQQETVLLETFANQLSLAIDLASLSSKQKTIQAQLRESEKQYRELFEKTNDIIWLEDVNGRILSGNHAFFSMLGMDAARLSGTNIFDYMPEADKAKRVRKQLQLNQEQEKSYDQSIINNRGNEIILKVTTNLMLHGDQPGYQNIAKDITEERKLQENMEYYIKNITQAQEDERLRISRELHDSTAQSLIVVLHQLEKFLISSKHLYVSDSRFLYTIVEQVKAVLQEVRQFSRDLRPSILDDLGLVPSLEWYFDELNRLHGINVSLRVQGTKQMLRPEVRVTVFRIIQEALRNIIRHAKATDVIVSIIFGEFEVKVTVTDNGVGFDSQPLGDLLRLGKLGLAGMHERAKLLGGKLEISSETGGGTTVTILLPQTTLTTAGYT